MPGGPHRPPALLPMTDRETLRDVKRKLSDTLLNEQGVSGVGLRGESIVVYLETGDDATRKKVERTARALAPEATVRLEVSGRFSKQ